MFKYIWQTPIGLMSITIGIIGTGLSGSLCAINLLKNSQSPIKILLFEKDAKRFARGVAYSNDFTYQPLNVVADAMSLFEDKPLHFYHWTLERKNEYSLPEDFNPKSFISRKIFGDYLTDTLEQTIQDHAQHSVTVVYDEVCSVSQSTHQYKVFTTHEGMHHCNKIILALGNFPPANFQLANNDFLDNEYYEANPWRVGLVDDIKAEEDILFVGSGLTMVDLLINLKQKNHKGKIFVVSRKGLLPNLHKPYNTNIISWSDEELYSGLHNLFVSLRKKIKEKNNEGIDWRNIIDSLRLYTPSIWKSFSHEEKNIFFRRLRSYWEIHRHRVPQESMRLIQHYFDKEELKLFAAKLEEIHVEENSFFVSFINNKLKIKQAISVNRIINCTGPESNYKNLSNSIIAEMLEKNYLSLDNNNYSLLCNSNGAALTKDEKINEHLYLIGPIRKTTEWESTALREIRSQSILLANALLDSIKVSIPR
jgi:uncharacterized NAD(P)/FAD-binding protein YdhS